MRLIDYYMSNATNINERIYRIKTVCDLWIE